LIFIQQQTEQPTMITRKLPVKLTREEIHHRGKRLAVLEAEITDLEFEKKEAAGNFKSLIEGRKTEVGRRTREINEEQEYRQVEIIEQKDWDTREVLTIRKDTGEVVEARPMTPEERQRPIPFNTPRPADEFVGEVMDQVADQINDGALGSNVKATRKRA
jgi:hypothetical protein